jgi:hypothetical protein
MLSNLKKISISQKNNRKNPYPLTIRLLPKNIAVPVVLPFSRVEKFLRFKHLK